MGQPREGLWLTEKPFELGPREELAAWERASTILDGLMRAAEGFLQAGRAERRSEPSGGADEAALMALVDAAFRIREQRGLLEEELEGGAASERGGL